MAKAIGTTYTNKDIDGCPNCGSTLGPFLDKIGGTLGEVNTSTKVIQIICSTCGMRGPYQRNHETAEEAWNKLPRKDKK